MSIHSSLKVTSGSSGQRNVWTRMERIAALKKQGRWNDGDKVTGLRKVRTRFKAKAKPKKAEAAPAAAGGAAAPAAAKAAAPAAPAAKAAPAKK